MTTTINATLLQKQFHDTDIAIADAEIVIDGAINILNTFGADIDNLTGTTPNMTGTYTSAQAGAIITLSQKVYAKHYTNPSQTSSVQLGPAGSGFGSDSELLTYAEKLAGALKTASTTGNIAIFVSNDPVPT